MKTLTFLFSAYVVITSAMAVMELNDRMQDHYVSKYMSATEAMMPEHLKVGMR